MSHVSITFCLCFHLPHSEEFYLLWEHEFQAWHGRNFHIQSLHESCRKQFFCLQSVHEPLCEKNYIAKDITPISSDLLVKPPKKESYSLVSQTTQGEYSNLKSLLTTKDVNVFILKHYLSSWHISRLSLSRGVRRRTVAPSSSVLMSELSWRLQRLYLWPLVTTTVPPEELPTESLLDSLESVPETELFPALAAVPAPASAPSGLLSEGQTAVILQGMPSVDRLSS